MSGDTKTKEESQDELDAKFKISSLFFKNRKDMGTLTVHPDSIYYNMNHSNRGKCLIINNKTFEPYTNCPTRTGTDRDFDKLSRTFESFGFEVTKLKDPGIGEVMDTLRIISKSDHSDNDCFVCCILTHGDEGVLWAKDAKYPVENVFKFFKGDNCVSLAGKPKLFFIQACRGTELDTGVRVFRKDKDVADSSSVVRIPTWADFLMAYSCVPGHYSWRNTLNGSWFIESLTDILEQFHSHFDLLSMLTIVNKQVAYSYESNVPNNAEMHNKKMVSCITHMLTRQIILNKKEINRITQECESDRKNGKVADVEMKCVETISSGNNQNNANNQSSSTSSTATSAENSQNGINDGKDKPKQNGI